jgi:hypothetical protein
MVIMLLSGDHFGARLAGTLNMNNEHQCVIRQQSINILAARNHS